MPSADIPKLPKSRIVETKKGMGKWHKASKDETCDQHMCAPCKKQQENVHDML